MSVLGGTLCLLSSSCAWVGLCPVGSLFMYCPLASEMYFLFHHVLTSRDWCSGALLCVYLA